MVALLRRNLAQQAPTGAVSIDWSHPLAQGLILCARMGRDMVSGMPMAMFAGSPAPSAAGPGWTWEKQPNWNTGGSVFIPRVNVCSAYTVMSTMSASAAPSVTGPEIRCMLLDSDNAAAGPTTLNGTARIFQHRIMEGSGFHAFVPFYSGGAGYYEWYSASSLCNGRPHVVGCVGMAGRYEQWVDGVVINSGTAAGAPITSATQVTGQSHHGVSVPITAMWNRGLSWGEIQRFTAEPYAFLTQGPVRSIFLMGALSSPFRPQVLVIG